MGMGAAGWEVLGKAANLAQMSGLHAAVLVVLLTTIVRFQQRNDRECARLERCHRRLHALLQLPTGRGYALLCSVMGDPVKALADAAGLVDCYKKSTLWHRLRSGGRMTRQLRDMHDVVDSFCYLLLLDLNMLFLAPAPAIGHHHAVPASSDTSNTTVLEANDTPETPSRSAATEARATDPGGMDNDEADTGCERKMDADLLPIVISQA